MPDNFLYIPELNPIIFFEVGKTNLPKYFTKQFEDYPFAERQYYWQQREDYLQVWQTTDIINLQFESTFDPIIVKLLDDEGTAVITLPALIGLANKFLTNTWSFEVMMSLAGLTTGCYRLQIEAGTGGGLKTYLSDCQYISSDPLPNTLCLEYWNSRYHKDVLFESGIKFQFRVPGVFGYLDKARKDEAYRDEKYNPALLNSRSSKQWPVYFGIPAEGIISQSQFCGLPDDIINIIEEIWSCDNVLIDNKAFGMADGTKPEYTVIDSNGLYPKRGMKVTAEAGINRNSRVFAVETDVTKKLVTSIIVEAKVFGDTSNQGSANTVPVFNVE